MDSTFKERFLELRAQSEADQSVIARDKKLIALVTALSPVLGIPPGVLSRLKREAEGDLCTRLGDEYPETLLYKVYPRALNRADVIKWMLGNEVRNSPLWKFALPLLVENPARKVVFNTKPNTTWVMQFEGRFRNIPMRPYLVVHSKGASPDIWILSLASYIENEKQE